MQRTQGPRIARLPAALLALGACALLGAAGALIPVGYDHLNYAPDYPHYGWHDKQIHQRMEQDLAATQARNAREAAFKGGLFVKELPKGYTTEKVGEMTYYQADGTYYTKRDDGQYVVVPDPMKRKGCVEVQAGDKKYYYLAGVFYDFASHGHKRVPAPVGAIVPNVPFDADVLFVGSTKYYESNGVRYKPLFKDGAVTYEVVDH